MEISSKSLPRSGNKGFISRPHFYLFSDTQVCTTCTLAIYALMIYTALCVMFLMRADTLRGQVGWGWALEIESFFSPVKWHRANRRVPFGAQKTRYFQGPTPSLLPK
jgi:hypothetical protein